MWMDKKRNVYLCRSLRCLHCEHKKRKVTRIAFFFSFFLFSDALDGIPCYLAYKS